MATASQAKIILTAEDRSAAAFASASRGVDKFERSIEALRTAVLGYAAVAGAALLAVNAQAEKVAAFQGLSEQIGDTAENVASLKLASDISGVALESLATASVRLTANLAKTDDETKGIGAAIKSIGLELGAFKKLSPVEQIDAVAQALAGFEDGAAKTAVAVELFGRSGAELIPLFNDLAGGAQRQISLTTEQIAAADAYTKQTARLRSEIETLVLVTSAGAVPTLSAMVSVLQETLKYSNDSTQGISLLSGALGAARTAMEAIVLIGSDVAFVFRTIGDTAGAYAAVSARLIAGDIAGAKAIGAAYREVSAERRAALDGFQQRIARPVIFGADNQSDAESRRLGLNRSKPSIRFSPSGSAAGGRSSGRSSGGAGSAPKDPFAEAQRYLDTLQKQLEATDKLSVSDALLRDLQLGRLGKTTPAIEAALIATAKQLDLDKELEAATRQALDLKTETVRKNEELAEAGRRVYESTREPLELLNIEQAKLNELLAAGVVNFDTFARASLDLEERYRSGPAAAISELEQFTQRAAQNIQDNLGDTFANILDGNFKNIGDSFTQLINRMVAEAAAAQLSKYLFGDLAGGKGGGGGLFGEALGSFFGPIFGGARAQGGPVSSGRAYLVGERGPEMFMPSMAGAIIPNNKMGGRVTNISVSVAMPQGGNRATALQFGTDAARQISRANARNG